MKKLISFLAITLAVIFMLTACGGSIQKKVVGTWYKEGADEYTYRIYDDGTYVKNNDYGTGKWSIVNDNQLKLTDFYGESVVKTVSFDGDKMFLDDNAYVKG